ncbi:MAG: hypothetical protein U0936_12285 [Planctomycetaceae bacterium]
MPASFPKYSDVVPAHWVAGLSSETDDKPNAPERIVRVAGGAAAAAACCEFNVINRDNNVLSGAMDSRAVT